MKRVAASVTPMIAAMATVLPEFEGVQSRGVAVFENRD